MISDNFEQDDMDILDKVGQQYGINLWLPPFNNSNHPFYSIKEDNGLCDLLTDLSNLGYSFKVIESVNDIKYIEIVGKSE